MLLSYQQLQAQFYKVLSSLNFTPEKATICANIFAGNSRDGVHSHGLNRFPVFVQYVKEGLIDIHAEPKMVGNNGIIENWNAQLAPGMYAANIAMERAIELSTTNGIGIVTLQNTNHWMRGGTYGWQAADAGCIGICTTNTIAVMPAWGGTKPVLGNNPIVIAVPRAEGHVVLDMAISQFSYGKMQEYELAGKQLPFAGGYDEAGELTTDPTTIKKLKSTLPIGYWKGSGLSLMIDLLVAGLSGGRTVAEITATKREFGVSQLFIAINAANISPQLVNNVLEFTKANAGGTVQYPGEQVLAARKKAAIDGIPANEMIWQKVLELM
ncbi:MAG: 3-dehydro-L-gulonate 2-dehydrogenase [Chitinophagaceae bacterium]